MSKDDRELGSHPEFVRGAAKIALEMPETIFTEDAQRLFVRIDELERSGAPAGHIKEARELLNLCLTEMDAAFAAVR